MPIIKSLELQKGQRISLMFVFELGALHAISSFIKDKTQITDKKQYDTNINPPSFLHLQALRLDQHPLRQSRHRDLVQRRDQHQNNMFLSLPT